MDKVDAEINYRKLIQSVSFRPVVELGFRTILRTCIAKFATFNYRLLEISTPRCLINEKSPMESRTGDTPLKSHIYADKISYACTIKANIKRAV